MVDWDSIIRNVCEVLFGEVKLLGSINSNVDKLSNETQWLGGLMEHLLERAEHMTSQETQISEPLQIWSRQVTSLIKECHKVERRLEECGSSWNCFSCGCYFNHALAIEVARLLKEKERLQTKYHEFTPENMVIDVVPDNVEYIPFRLDYKVVGQENVMEKALALLEQNIVVGIWGMGGVGKTTLLKCIYNEYCANRDTFAVIIFLTVGRDKWEIIIPKMQTTIGKAVGLLGLSENGNTEKQEKRIRDSLDSRNFLLIMDDLWVDPRDILRQIGIPPLNHLSAKQKVVIASRDRKVCYPICGCFSIVEMRLFQESESWDLLGTKVDGRKLHETEEIKTLAEAIINKCGYLPLALHHVGESMASSPKSHQWKKVITELESLQESSMMQMQVQGKGEPIVFNSMVENVLSILKFSFEELKCEVTRDILLKLFQSHNTLLMGNVPTDQSDIVNTIIGDSRDSEDKKINVHCCITTLIDSSLLLEYREGLKLHIFVYDTFLWLKYQEGLEQGLPRRMIRSILQHLQMLIRLGTQGLALFWRKSHDACEETVLHHLEANS